MIGELLETVPGVIPTVTQDDPNKDRQYKEPDSQSKLLVEKLLKGEISEEASKLALQTLGYQKPEIKKTHEIGYHL